MFSIVSSSSSWAAFVSLAFSLITISLKFSEILIFHGDNVARIWQFRPLRSRERSVSSAPGCEGRQFPVPLNLFALATPAIAIIYLKALHSFSKNSGLTGEFFAG